MKFELKPLPYAYHALEPFIDEQTMLIHHDKHHQAYVDKLNAALEGHPELQKKSVEELVAGLNSVVPESVRGAVRNHGGGHLNHSFFWDIMKKDAQTPSTELSAAINTAFGSMDAFKEKFSNAALGVFGSGWAWLVVSSGSLEVMSTPNQDSPLTVGKKPILGVDVWEHAYYIRYMNRRADYVKAFWNVVNWSKVSEHFKHAMK
ncbi:MAG: superoxide dismutase [Candidatus Diapherotrites archaeon]|nr:superoxide dismutase [Candidatus Diapherotrites archaeon]